MNKVVKSLIAVVVVGALGAGGLILFKQKTAVDTTPKNLFSVRKIDLNDSISFVGKAVSDNVKLVYGETDGVISQMSVVVGDYVKKGDVICKFDVEDLTAQREEYVKKLEDYEKSREQQKSNYDENNAYQQSLKKEQLKHVQEMISYTQKKYEEELRNESYYKSKYDECANEVESYKENLNNVKSEIKELEAKFEEYSKNPLMSAGENAQPAMPDAAAEKPEGAESETVNPEEMAMLQEAAAAEVPDLSAEQDRYQYLMKEQAKLEVLINLADGKKQFYNTQQSMSKSNAEELNTALKSYNDSYELMQNQGGSSSLTAEEYALSVSGDDLKKLYNDQIKALDKKINSAVLKSSEEGIVTKLFVNNGDHAMGVPICEIQDKENLHFEGYISPSFISKISKDNRIIVSMAVNNYEESNGKILEISDYYSATDRGYKVSFTIDGINDQEIYPGFEVSSKIVIAEQKDTLVVPYDAVFEKDGKNYVRKYDAFSEMYQDVEAEVGLETSYYVAVTSENLKEKDVVMTEMIQQ